MERRHFLGLALGLTVSTALAATAQAVPLSPRPLTGSSESPELNKDAHPAVTSTAEVDQLKPEAVHWGRHWHRRWHRRHWGWRRRHWGWRRHRWHHHHGHHHHWRRHW